MNILSITDEAAFALSKHNSTEHGHTDKEVRWRRQSGTADEARRAEAEGGTGSFVNSRNSGVRKSFANSKKNCAVVTRANSYFFRISSASKDPGQQHLRYGVWVRFCTTCVRPCR